jgi:hypothetical protein
MDALCDGVCCCAAVGLGVTAGVLYAAGAERATTGGGGGRVDWVVGTRGATIVGFCPTSPPVVPEATNWLLKRLTCMDLKLPPHQTPPCHHPQSAVLN